MPLMITNAPVCEIPADMTVYVREKDCSEKIPFRSFLRKYLEELRSANTEKRIRNVYYTASADYPAFEKSYRNALKRAVRCGYETVAVSCEDEVGFILANHFSKRFAKELDLRIWLCLSEDVTVSGSSIAMLENIFFDDEALPGISLQQDDCDDDFIDSSADSLRMPVKMEAPYALHSIEEEYEDCAILGDETLAPPPMPQDTFSQIPRKTAAPQKHSVSRPLTTSAKPKGEFIDLREFLKKNDAGFKDTLLKYIDRTGKKDSEIYRKANVDRRLFSKIMNLQGYNPSKPTAIAFAIALELNLEEAKDLIGRAGYTLSQASTFDRIIEFFILEGNYDIYEINEALFYFDQSLLGC